MVVKLLRHLQAVLAMNQALCIVAGPNIDHPDTSLSVRNGGFVIDPPGNFSSRGESVQSFGIVSTRLPLITLSQEQLCELWTDQVLLPIQESRTFLVGSGCDQRCGEIIHRI